MTQRLALYLDLIRFDRPAGWLLLLWPTLSALWLAAGGFPGWHLLAVFILGTILMRSAGCAVNDVADREFDRHVKRTAQRPVTSGRVGVREALGVGAALAFLAWMLVWTLHVHVVAASVLGLVITILYPFAKRFVSMPQAVLGVAFGVGIPLSYVAVNGFGVPSSVWAWWDMIPWQAWALSVSNLFWVLAYDTEYAMVDRDDDLKIGIRTSAITLGSNDVRGVMVFYAIHLFSWAWLADLWSGTAGLVAWLVAAGQVVWHYFLIRHRNREGCFQAFKANHWIGFSLFVGLVLNGWV